MGQVVDRWEVRDLTWKLIGVLHHAIAPGQPVAKFQVMDKVRFDPAWGTAGKIDLVPSYREVLLRIEVVRVPGGDIHTLLLAAGKKSWLKRVAGFRPIR